MDAVTHLLTGATIAHGWFGRPDVSAKRAAVVSMVAALFPDVDRVLLWAGSEAYLRHSDGITHALVLVPVWAAFLAGVAWLVDGQQRFRFWWTLCAVNVACHIALDVATRSGPMIWIPFSDQRVALSWVFILDPFVWALLALAVWSVWRMNQPRWTRVWVWLLCGYIACCGGLRWMALCKARGEPTGKTVAAYPQPLNPFGWTLVSRQGDRVTWQSGDRADVFVSYQDDILVPQAEVTEAVKLFCRYAAFPVVERVEEGRMTILRYRDLRFRTALPGGRISEGRFLVAEVMFDVDGRLMTSRIVRGR